MLAYRRADIDELNQAAHALMLRAGRLGPDPRTFGEREFGVGDRVLCRHNDPRLVLRNGTRATIVDVGQHGLTIRTDGGAMRRMPSDYAAEHVGYGYALTGHAAQGATVDRAFVLIEDRGALQEWGYVACSRARRETHLYLATPPFDPDLPRDAPRTGCVPERIARALAAQAAEPLAIDQAEPVDRVTARALAARRQLLERQCVRAEQRLVDAEAKLDRLGWRDRRKYGAGLRAEISFQRSALRQTDEQLAASPAQPPGIARAHEHEQPSRERLQELEQRRRQTFERARARTLERDRGLELDW
jgi:hypothetical protein